MSTIVKQANIFLSAISMLAFIASFGLIKPLIQTKGIDREFESWGAE